MPGADGARHALRSVQRWVGDGLDLLFPTSCLGCGQAGFIWCPACDASLERIGPDCCQICGRRLAVQAVCAECRRRPPPYRARSYAAYHGRLARAIVSLKYRPNRRLAERMGEWLYQLLRQTGWQAHVLVPVPLSRQRQKRRGYNQAHLLALALRERAQLPVLANGLRRVLDTHSQVGLMPAERKRNVANAFAADERSLAGQHVILVDDLYTTGATLAACAAALRGAGAEQVFALTVARA